MNCSPPQTNAVVLYVYLPIAELFAFSECAVCTLCVRVPTKLSPWQIQKKTTRNVHLQGNLGVKSQHNLPRFCLHLLRQNHPQLTHTQAGYYRPPLTPRTACDPSLHTLQRPGILHRAFKWIFKANPPHALIWAGSSPSGHAKPVSGEATGLQGSR